MIPTLREATGEDAALIASLVREAWAGMFPPGSSGHRLTADKVRAALEEGGGLVLEVGGEPAGSVMWAPVPGAWEVMKLALRPAYRGRGLSSWLLNEITYRALSNGVGELRLAVRRDAPGLVRFYERQGFFVDPDATYSHANPKSPPPVVMRRRLQPVVPVGEAV